MKRMIPLSLITLAMAGLVSSAAPKKEYTVNDAVAAAKSRHVLYSIDCLNHTAFINEAAWNGVDYPQKKYVVDLFSKYCEGREGMTPEIRLYGNHTGHELGGKTMWSKMYVK